MTLEQRVNALGSLIEKNEVWDVRLVYPNEHGTESEEAFLVVSSHDDVEKLESLWNTVHNANDPDEETDRLDEVVEFGFSDEYDCCLDCGSVIRTSPDSYCWQLEAQFVDGEGYVCSECIDAESYLEDCKNENRLVNTHLVDPSDHLWTQLEDLDFQNGLYGGQKADPEAVVKALNAEDIDCLFTGSVGQFDVRFRVWVPEGDEDRAREVLEGSRTDLPYDPAVEMSKALSSIGKGYQGSEHIQVVEREITREEFIDGSWAREEHAGTIQSVTIKKST